MCGELSYEMELLSGFIDSCLPLTPDEEKVLEAELAKLPPEECEGVMEIITSWRSKGDPTWQTRIDCGAIAQTAGIVGQSTRRSNRPVVR
jgi:hypothetical protein